MDCPICTNKMVLAKATNFGDEYHYCRGCKKELKEMQSSLAPLPRISDTALELAIKEAADIFFYTGSFTHKPTPNPPQPGAPTAKSCGMLHVWDFTRDVCFDCGMTGVQFIADPAFQRHKRV